jgi:RNA polymerase sigma factor (sigma-70 family)
MGRRTRDGGDDLLDGFRHGESWALTTVWNRYSSPVTGYLRGRGIADAEDITSEVFLQVFRTAEKFRGDEKALRTFIFSVAHARYVDDVRRTSRRGVVVEFDASAHDGLTESAEAEAMTALAAQRVEQLLDALSPDQREVLLLRIVADLSLEQTAGVLGRTVGAVKALQHRGLAALRPLVEELVSK